MAPSVGRIVHFYDENGAGPVPAIITDVKDADAGVVHLTVFPPCAPPETNHDNVKGGAGAKQGSWEWPDISPATQQAPAAPVGTKAPSSSEPEDPAV